MSSRRAHAVSFYVFPIEGTYLVAHSVHVRREGENLDWVIVNVIGTDEETESERRTQERREINVKNMLNKTETYCLSEKGNIILKQRKIFILQRICQE